MVNGLRLLMIRDIDISTPMMPKMALKKYWTRTIKPSGSLNAREIQQLIRPLLCRMSNELSVREVTILKSLPDYGILSLTQLAVLHFPSKQMARIKARQLHKAGLVEFLQRDFADSPGKPEGIMHTTEKAIKSLKESGLITGKESNLTPTVNIRNINHQLLINWVRIHIMLIGSQQSRLKVNFLSPNLMQDIYRIDVLDSKLGTILIPDGIFSITDELKKKSLLFFLEVDMGTETLASQNQSKNDFKRKILEYQYVFGTARYKEFESHLEARFNGFRILVVADSKSRFDQLCRLVKSIKATGFIWLTDKDSLFANGISDKIWVKGGNSGLGLYSILGPTLVFKCPINIPQ